MMLRGEPGAVRYSANLDKTCLAISPSPPHTCRKYFAAGSKIGILAIFQFGFESFTIVKSTKIKDFEQISVCLVILQVQIWRTVAFSTGMASPSL